MLENKLQLIAMGKDPACVTIYYSSFRTANNVTRICRYSDQLVRRTMAVFYGQVKDDNFRRQMKENRKIEELILMFATNATNVLKKDPTLAGDKWKNELNNHIALFVKLLRDCLRGLSHVSPELTQRLDVYTTKLAPQQQSGTSYSDSGYDSSSTTRDRDSVVSPNRISKNITDMPLVLTVARLFKIPEHALQGEIDQTSKFCTEKVDCLSSLIRGSRSRVINPSGCINRLEGVPRYASGEPFFMVNYQTCLKNLNAGSPFPGRREDFQSEAAFQHWRTLETSHLSQLMVVMVQFNPELAKSTPGDLGSLQQASNARPTSIYSVSGNNGGPTYHPGGRNPSVSSKNSRLSVFSPGDLEGVAEDLDADEDLPLGHHYTFIPPNPKKFYKRLLELCLLADLEAMLSPNVGDEDQVSLGILTDAHIELINECALRWRIGQPYRVSCFLDLIRQFYERTEVPIECIPEALANVKKVRQDMELDKWPTQDVGTIEFKSRPTSSRIFSATTLRTCLEVCTLFSWARYTTPWRQSLNSKRPRSSHTSRYSSQSKIIVYCRGSRLI